MWNYQYWNSAEFYVNMASQDSLTSETCVLGSLCYCGNDVSHPVSGRILGSKGLATLIDVSRKRGDGLYNDMIAGQSYFIHNKCYKTYTAARNIALAQRGSVNNSAAPALRSQQNIFRYETHCLICATELDFQSAKKYPGSKHDISQIEIVNRDGKSIIQNTLLSLCELRTDAHALEVKARIQYAGDIRAVEAKYHRRCMQRFLVTKPNSNTETENVASAQDHLNDLAFHEICKWMSADGETGKQFTMATLHARLKDYLPDGYEPYTRKHLKRRLQEHFQGNITIADLDGKASIITLAERATEILHESYVEAEGSTEFDKMVRELGSVIHQDLLNIDQPTDVYPTPVDIDIDSLEFTVPPHLQGLIDAIFTESRSETAVLKKRLLKTGICHVIMNAAGRQSFISPLLLSVGLFIHQTTRSRILLDVLSSLGLCVPYSTVMAFQRSAVLGQRVEDLPVGMNSDKSDTNPQFCQWIADNFDFNEDTLTGSDTTHVMGIITCQTPGNISKNITVPRCRPSAAELLEKGNFGSIIKPYKSPVKSKLSNVVLEELSIDCSNRDYYLLLDTLWLYSSKLHPSPPNWQGFMATVTQGTWQTTTVVYNPMVPLNPGTDDAVYSTMSYVRQQATKAGMCCATLTFDQPLYLKAYKIKCDNPQEFSQLFLRLGGFHLLMSFLGAGCKLMEGSGLEELWATVYANNSIPKMMEGKAYSRTLRACLLTDAALHLVLLQCNSTDEDSKPMDNTVSIPDELDESSLSDDEISETTSVLSVDTSSIQWDKDQQTMASASPIDMECQSSQVLESSGPMVDSLKLDYQALLDGKVSEENTENWDTLLILHREVCKMKDVEEGSRTGKLWLNFTKFMAIVRMFIRAERTGNWGLHLEATYNMLPFLAAAGHNNYTKSCRLYLQDCQRSMCQCLKQQFNNGLFTIRRNSAMFWSGTWTDMTIEQCLMRSGKTSGGLINVTHKDSARMKWLLSAHIVAQYSDALRALTQVQTGTWSEQHRDMTLSGRKHDHEDLHKFTLFLQQHSPFCQADKTSLVNIATGVVADCRVNTDQAITVGWNVHSNLTGQRFGDVSLRRADQATTFKYMRKPVKIQNENMYMSSSEMYQRLLSIACIAGPPDTTVFSHELAAVAPSLFHDDGTMRKTSKSQLAGHILKQMDTNRALPVEGQSCAVVYDGAAVLHRLSWPKLGSMETVCELFKDTLTPSVNGPACIVFDSYNTLTTKAPEQKRRRTHYTPHPDVRLELSTPVPAKDAFLANMNNKQAIMNLLGSYMSQRGYESHHAGDEGDADVIIVRKALEYARAGFKVIVSANDTDILVLLLYHVSSEMDVSMYRSGQDVIPIRALQESLGQEMCQSILFAHAISGCDTTSAMFGLGKLKAFKILQQTPGWRTQVSIFGDLAAPHSEIGKIGEQFVISLYAGKTKLDSLDELRHHQFISPKYMPLERMAPTSRANYFHCLRVHHQVSTWRHLKTVLPMEDYGFIVVGSSVAPLISDKAPAPSELLQDVRCSCKSTSIKLCSGCTCSKYQIPCSIHCKCGGLCDNGMILDQ